MPPRKGEGGSAGQRGSYLGENPVDISKDVVVPKAHNPIATCLDLACSPLICGTSFIVLSTIEFDDQPCFAADEVDDEGTDQGLPAEMRS